MALNSLRKLIFSVFALIFFFGKVSAQDSESVAEQKNHSIFLTFGPLLMLNTDNTSNGAPSPILYSFGGGADFYFYDDFFAEPRLSFFTNYYLFDGENAQPAEIENRTASALSFMLDLTAGRRFEFGKHTLLASGGAGILARFAFLAGDVDSSDSGTTNGSTAGDDVSSINSWFWSNLNFFYPQLNLCYLYKITDALKIGCDFRAYIPLSSILSQNGLDGMIFSLAAKLCF